MAKIKAILIAEIETDANENNLKYDADSDAQEALDAFRWAVDESLGNHGITLYRARPFDLADFNLFGEGVTQMGHIPAVEGVVE